MTPELNQSANPQVNLMALQQAHEALSRVQPYALDLTPEQRDDLFKVYHLLDRIWQDLLNQALKHKFDKLIDNSDLA